MKYCPQCREPMHARQNSGTTSFVCESETCDFVHWTNPIPVVAGLVEFDGKFILGRNAAWPEGRFSMFTGFLETGESPESGIVREVEEEIGLETSVTLFLGHFPLPRFNQLIIAFALQSRGKLRLSPEIPEVKFVTPAQLQVYDFGPFTLTKEVVNKWKRLTQSLSE